MGREKDPFHGRKHPHDEGKYRHEDEYDEYEDDLEYDEDFEDDEYASEDPYDTYEKGSNVPRRSSAASLPPFPSTRNVYPRTKRASRMPGSAGSSQPPRPKRQIQPPNHSQQPPLRRSTGSTGSYQRPPQPPQYHTRPEDLPRRSNAPRTVSLAPHKRRVWPIFLIGCASGVVSLAIAGAIVVLITIRSVQNGGIGIPGIINTAKPFTQKSTQSAPLSFISQVIICDSAGNASLKVDPNVTTPTVTTIKTVHADNQADANQKLRQISVDIQPPSQLQKPLTCQKPQTITKSSVSTTKNSNATTASTPAAVDTTILTVNVTFPTDYTGESVDVAIALPLSTVQSNAPTNTLISIEAPLGNINIDGISGIMNLKGFSGSITVQNAELVDGSRLETEGNITFNGFLDIKDITHTQPNQPIHYILSSGHQIDVTLPPANTSIILDANTNIGKITSDFPINPKNNTGNTAASYNGPLTPGATLDPNTTPLLTLNTSTGNVTLHKK